MDERFREDPSPFGAHLGFRMADWREDFARFEMEIAPHHGNRYGVPHGGAYATLLDAAMGHAGCWTGDPEVKQVAFTLSLNVQYLSLPTGKRLIVEARRTGGGRATYFADGEVRDETGALIAKGSGVFRYRRQAG
ncbi:PaaI family thioesterase [Salipiger mucosus]|nr:PaaI family thioesterase [Salipiger mucosus]